MKKGKRKDKDEKERKGAEKTKEKNDVEKKV